jgi:hypothetical protein
MKEQTPSPQPEPSRTPVDEDPPDDATQDDAGDGEQDDVPRPVHAVRTTTPKAAASPPSTPKPSSGKRSPTPPERPLWTRTAPPELDDQEAERWENARRHVDPERDEYAADPLERQQWLALLEQLDEVAAHRRA